MFAKSKGDYKLELKHKEEKQEAALQTNVETRWWTVQVKTTSHLAPAHRLIRMSPLFTDRLTGQQMSLCAFGKGVKSA